MGRKSIAAIRRQEILEVFRQLIIEEGFEGASMTKVAKRMRVNSSLLFHYFSTKDEVVSVLIEQLLEKYEQHFEPTFSAIKNPSKRFQAVLDAIFSTEWDELAEGQVFYSSYPLIFRNPEIKLRFQKLYHHFHGNLMKELELAKEAGVIETDDLATSAHLIITMVEGINFYENILGNNEVVSMQYEVIKEVLKQKLKFSS